jgi:hypothetical protein
MTDQSDLGDQKFRVKFDGGQEVVVEFKSRDLAKLERSGISIDESNAAVGTYALAFVALSRMDRAGLIDFALPENVEGLEDIADIEVIEDPDPSGEGSAPVAVTG